MITDGPYEGPGKGWTEIPTKELEALERKLAERDQTIARLTTELDRYSGPTGYVAAWQNEAETNRQAYLKAEAEVARLLRMRGEDEQLVIRCHKRAEQAEAEVARLRKALGIIAAHAGDRFALDADGFPTIPQDSPQEIAATALTMTTAVAEP